MRCWKKLAPNWATESWPRLPPKSPITNAIPTRWWKRLRQRRTRSPGRIRPGGFEDELQGGFRDESQGRFEDEPLADECVRCYTSREWTQWLKSTISAS